MQGNTGRDKTTTRPNYKIQSQNKAGPCKPIQDSAMQAKPLQATSSTKQSQHMTRQYHPIQEEDKPCNDTTRTKRGKNNTRQYTQKQDTATQQAEKKTKQAKT